MKIFWELTGIFREPCKNKNILFRWEKNIYLVWSVYIPTLPLTKYWLVNITRTKIPRSYCHTYLEL